MLYKFRQYFLKNTSRTNILMKEKANLLLNLIVIILTLIVPFIFLYLFFFGYKYEVLYPVVNLLILLSGLFLLKKGYYIACSHFLLIGHFALVWFIVLMRFNKAIPFARKMNILIYLFCIIFVVPLLIRRKKSILFTYLFTNFIILLAYIFLLWQFSIYKFDYILSNLSTYIIAFLFISITAFFFFKTFYQIIKKYEVTDENFKSQNEMLELSNESFELINEQLVESKKKYKNLYNNSLVGMLTINLPDGQIINLNDSAKKFLNISDDEFKINKIYLKKYYNNEKEYKNHINAIIEKGSQAGFDLTLKQKNGNNLWIEAFASFYRDEKKIEFVLADVTSRKNAEKQVLQLTFYDELTKLPNKALLSTRIDAEILKSQRKNKENIFAVMCLGVDRFKNINEMYGPIFGDKLLQDISNQLIENVRDDDLVTRFESDKFMILFSDISIEDDISEIVKKISDVFQTPFKINSSEVKVTSSIGICMYPNDGNNPEVLMKNSEAAMFAAKEMGRNNHQLFDIKMNEKLLEYIRLEQELMDAIDYNEFVTYYQPKVDFDGNLKGMEALIRWNSPTRGFVKPNDFIPMSEKSGLINKIGEIVLKDSCKHVKLWLDKGLPAKRVAVNLSYAQMHDKDLVDMIKLILFETKLDPSYLEFEITESGIMENDIEVIEKLKLLHKLGIKISIDDFGTGYSSLSKLKDYPIDTLKIDRSFIKQLPDDDKSSALTKTIIDMAHNLGFTVIAEGITNKKQLNFLHNNKCDIYQGFYFNEPMAPREFELLLRKIK